MEKKSIKIQLRDYFLISIGIIIMALGIYFFKFPNHFSTGGVTGIAVVLDKYFPSITPGTFVLIINNALLLIGFLVFGKGFGLKTAYASLLFSGAIWLMERLIPLRAPLTSQPLVELIFAVTLPAVGSAILFNLDASSGGTDIVAMVLKKYTSLDIGKALLLGDFLITIASGVAFGIEIGMFSVLGLLIKSMVLDLAMESLNMKKFFHIITANPLPIQEFIVKEIKRSATLLEGSGAYTHENRTIVLTAVNRGQAIRLRKFIKATDPTAFILITNTSEVIGKGFRGVM